MDDQNARLCVLENTADRHEADISKIWEELTNLKVCAASLPLINTSISRIDSKIDAMEANITGMKLVSGEQATKLAILVGAVVIVTSAIFTGLLNVYFRGI